MMRAVIEIDEETMSKLSGALDLSPIYDGKEIDEDELSYAIKLMIDLCTD